MKLFAFLCLVALAAARPSQVETPDKAIQDILEQIKIMKPIEEVSRRMLGVQTPDQLIQELLEQIKQKPLQEVSRRGVSLEGGFEVVTGAMREASSFLAELSKQVGPTMKMFGKRNIDLNDVQKLLAIYKQIGSLLKKRDLPVVEIQDFGLEDVTGAIKGVTGYLADISKTIGPALSAISIGKRDALPMEYQNTDWNKVLDDLKGVGKDVASIFANVGPAVASVVGKRDAEIQDFGLEDVTGAIKGVTGYLADISKTIGPALSAISIGKRDALPMEYQNTDWNKVLDDLKGVGKDVASIFANVGPAVASVVGKRDVEVQDFGLEDVTGAIKGVTGYLADISKTIGPALSAISIGKRDALPMEYQNTDWDKVLDDLKGVGKDIADIFANVGPAVASVVGKRDEMTDDVFMQSSDDLAVESLEVQDTDWNKVLDDLKGIGSDLGHILVSVAPAAIITAVG